MREATTISELRRALRRQGIWGARAERLLQEWTDHVHESSAQRIVDGAPAPAAEQAAWEALGQPHVLAASAARQLTRASWLGRRPWLAGLVLPLLAWLLVMAGLLSGPGLFYETLLNSPGCVRACELFAQWTPWLLSMAWLARLARTLSGGWKHYWITAIVLTLLATSVFIQIHIYPPPPGPRTGPLMVMTVPAMFVGILGTIVNTILYCTHLLPGVNHVDVFTVTTPWIQTAISLAGLLAFHAWSRSAFPESARSRPA